MSEHPWRRILVTGGAGFVGSRLRARLAEGGAEVVCPDGLSTGSRADVAEPERYCGFRFVRADATDPAALTALPGRFDLVLHFACPASPVDCLRLPLETLEAGGAGTRNALERARADGARFVLASTSEVCGDPLEHPQRETYWGDVNPIGPRSAYDESKRFAEALVAAHRRVHGTDTAIVRIFSTHGPRMRTGDGRAVPTFVAQALDGVPLTVAGDGSRTRSLCHVDDTVAGVLALAGFRETGPVDIGGGEEVTVLEPARRIVELTGSASRIRFVDRPVDDPARRRPGTRLARERLGWRPRTGWSEGLERTVGWFSRSTAA
ncbi:NAD-dependent epimerase/dehydratase family protein [Streptomyces griseomycini]|uniref:NAD-dependent epimerase/dehydratase family protein n=1 Tax=Streptomyces griseomycini TaxID=66895 RepID=UPI0034381B91